MACPDENDVVAFLARTMEPERVLEVEAHLADCRACRELLATSASDNDDATVPAVSAVDSSVGHDEPRGQLAQRVSHAQVMKRIGTTLCGKWTLDGFIGAGGMAHVFSGVRRNGRRVAVKILRPELALEPGLVRRFLREGYVANRVEHPDAVAVLDDDVDADGAPFLVMELLEGETLKARLARTGPIPAAEALRLADGLLAVFAAAHARGVVHRDIKPDNLFLTEDGRIKVLDFGIARLRESTQSAEAHTHSGQMIGTPGYMAPEQARGRTEAIDARTDVWALGATIFAMLSGRPLQSAQTVQELLGLAMSTPVRATRELSALVPEAVARVLDTALAFDKENRFENAAVLRDALREAAAADTSGNIYRRDAKTPETRLVETELRTPWWRWLAVGVAVVVTGFVIMLAVGRDVEQGPAPTATSASAAASALLSAETASSVRSVASAAAAGSAESARPIGSAIAAPRASASAVNPVSRITGVKTVVPPMPPAASKGAASVQVPGVEPDPLGPRR